MHALIAGHLETFWWAARNGDFVDRFSILSGSAPALRAACKGGHVDVLAFVVDAMKTLDPPVPVGGYEKRRLATIAAEHGQVKLLQWLRDESLLAYREQVLEIAAKNNQLATLDWLWESHLPTQSQWRRLYIMAVRDNQLPVLEWAHRRQLPWHAHACEMAINCNQLECLKWLREHGCPWGVNPLGGNGQSFSRTVDEAWDWAAANGAPPCPDVNSGDPEGEAHTWDPDGSATGSDDAGEDDYDDYGPHGHGDLDGVEDEDDFYYHQHMLGATLGPPGLGHF